VRIQTGLNTCVLSLLVSGSTAVWADSVYNLTGLPMYPNVNRAKMDDVARTDKMGHWCNRFSADSFAPLEVVEAWYRKTLINASETDLKNDERYKDYFNLVGVKLAIGIDYVTVFRTGGQTTTSIELFKCSAPP
jgi:hypothetical protein